jgi:hypothetical protein
MTPKEELTAFLSRTDIPPRALFLMTDALAAERRATVERIRQRMSASLDGPPEYSTAVWLSVVHAILAAEADR